MKVKRIAFLTEAINNHSGARAPLEIAKGLSRAGHKITIIAFSKNLDNLLKKELLALSMEVVAFEKPRGFVKSRLLPDLRIAKTLKTGGFDVVIAAAFLPSILAAKIAKIPVLKIYMGTQFNASLEKFIPSEKVRTFDKLKNTLANALIYTLELISVLLANKIVAISRFCSKELKRNYLRRADAFIYLGGNHLQPPKPNYQLPTTNYQLPLRLLSVSRITPYKNFHLLIETVKNLKNENVRLTIAGTPVNQKYLKYLKGQAPDNVNFELSPTDSKLRDLYSKCDVYVSCDRYLFFGLPIAEAAFFQKPAIALDYAAAPELIENNKTGFVVKSEQQLANCIRKFIDNHKLIDKMGKASNTYAQKTFNWDKITKDYLKLIQNW